MTLAQLLVVQTHDSAIDRLVHSRTTLPEFAVLKMLEDEQVHLDTERALVAAQRHEVEREQKRLEDEAAIITDRINLENERLYNGTITAHKDLQAIQDELNTLGARRAEIEDHVLETMEQGEPLDKQLADFDQKLASVETRRDQATDSLLESQITIDAEVETEHEQRAEAVALVQPGLVDEYEASRAACGGIGICRLIAKTCQGCHLTLPAVEFDRIRKEPEDSIVRCDECARILVR